MPVTWTPSEADLGSVNENVTFTDTITASGIDETTQETIVYDISITPNEQNPDTIGYGGGSISGRYLNSFDYTVKYELVPEGIQFTTVPKFEQIQLAEFKDMIDFNPSDQVSKIFSYTATASLGGEVVETKVYTKTVLNNWEAGKDSLKEYVRTSIRLRTERERVDKITVTGVVTKKDPILWLNNQKIATAWLSDYNKTINWWNG